MKKLIIALVILIGLFIFALVGCTSCKNSEHEKSIKNSGVVTFSGSSINNSLQETESCSAGKQSVTKKATSTASQTDTSLARTPLNSSKTCSESEKDHVVITSQTRSVTTESEIENNNWFPGKY